MVLLHALGEQAASWDDVAARFATRFRVVALDLRGHGASTWPGTYSFPLMRDDVLGVLDALQLHDLVLIGHSMGGTVAYLVAQAQPGRIARLVVEDVPPPFPRERPVPARPPGELPFDWAVVPAIVEEVNDPFAAVVEALARHHRADPAHRRRPHQSHPAGPAGRGL